MRRWNYIRKEELEEFIKKNPGVSTEKLRKRFHPNVRHTLRKLFVEGRVKRIKHGRIFKYYLNQAELQNIARNKEDA